MRRLLVLHSTNKMGAMKIKRKSQLRRWRKRILIGGYGEAGMAHFPLLPLADPFFSMCRLAH